MRILLIKTSSMGDLIHTLPALTDASKALSHVCFDWVTEESFVEIPRWHPIVDRIIPVALRRWRKELLAKRTRKEWQVLRQQLREAEYDLILDAQGLVKSAFLTMFAKGLRVGLDFRSARESLAAFAYQKHCKVNFYQHAIVRMRSLFSQALGYALPETPPDFGIKQSQFANVNDTQPYLVFLHGTTWTSKQWPESYWMALAKEAAIAGYRIKVSGGSDEEIARSKRIAEICNAVDVMPRLSIGAMATLVANAKGVVAVDTGFGHLAAALNVPTLSLYGSTNPAYTGAIGNQSIHLTTNFACTPCLKRNCIYKKPSTVTPACYETLPPQYVWQQLVSLIN